MLSGADLGFFCWWCKVLTATRVGGGKILFLFKSPEAFENYSKIMKETIRKKGGMCHYFPTKLMIDKVEITDMKTITEKLKVVFFAAR